MKYNTIKCEMFDVKCMCVCICVLIESKPLRFKIKDGKRIEEKIRYRTENGIAEFLEIFCSIIHGFSMPVKEEHKEFCRNVLIPLHKVRRLDKFHEQLVACCVQFVFKDIEIGAVILGGLLKYWPVQSPMKQEMFVAEIANILNAMVQSSLNQSAAQGSILFFLFFIFYFCVCVCVCVCVC